MNIGCFVGLVVRASVKLLVLAVCVSVSECDGSFHRVPEVQETTLFGWTLRTWVFSILRLRNK